MRIFNYKLFTGGRASVSFLVLLAKEMNAKKNIYSLPITFGKREWITPVRPKRILKQIIVIYLTLYEFCPLNKCYW
jgi:hypothetical protein